MSEPTRRDALPTIVTTPEVHVDDTAAAVVGQPVEAGSTEASPDSLPAGAAQSHGRNFSISSMGAGHARNASLTVPGGDAPPPSSPTLSTTSEMSAVGPDSPSPAYRTSLALRDNDPRTAHARQISIASAFTDASGELQSSRSDAPPSTANGGVPRSTSSQVKFEQSSPTSDGRGEKLHNLPDAAKKDEMKGVPADEADAAANLSGWQRFKANLHGKTRAGRAQAIQDEIDAEKKRQYEMDPAPFKYRPVELGELVDPKSVALLRDMGGVKGLLAALGTDGTSGLDVGGTKAEEEGVQRESEKDLERGAGAGEPRGADWVQATHEQREKVYGRNVLPTKKSKSLLLLMWLALQDKILILLCIAAVVSLALGLYTDFGADPEFVPQIVNGELTEVRAPQIDWVEGVAILIAVVIVDVVGSVNDYQKELQFKKLNAKKEERDVKVIRQGRPALMSVHDVCVGDVLQLEPGEILPADGVFLRGHNVKCDESGATGESDMIRKITYDEALEQLEAAEANGTKPPNRDCFLISGARVLEGAGEYVVIAVGPSSFNGKLMLSLRTEAEMTPLQAKLNRLAEIIAYCGSAAGLLLFVALMIRFFVSFRPGQPSLTPDERGKQFIDILVIAVTVVVVAVPEGLPLATTLALAFATKRMTEQNLLVRVLGACETMANASVICTDKTGTLTQNEMSVVAGSVGVHLKFAYNLEENKGRIESPEDDSAAERMASRSSLQRHEGRRDWAIDQQELGSVISGKLRTLLSDSISVNSSAFEEVAEEGDDKKAAAGPGVLNKVSFLRRLLPKKKVEAEKTKQLGFVGSKTETALLKMAKELGWEDYRVSRERNEVVTSFPFSSERKAMGVVIRKPEGGYRFLVKGASEVLTKICTRHVIVPDPDSGDEAGEVQTAAFTKESQENVAKTIIFYANQTLRTIGVCYRDFDTPSWPPAGATMTEEGELDYDFLARDLTLLAVVGIEDPLRPGVRDAVAACTQAGVQVKMCTGDNALTARSIATQCGIYTPGGIIMEGPVFRKLSDADMDAVVPRLQVLARSSPEDKKILVERLKRMGEIVGVTGDGTNDGPALKAANVGFSMGIAGTEVAKEASDIILMDDNFASIVKAIMWGRCVNDAVRRFLQFQLSVNVGAVLITFISAVASDEGSSVLGAVQLLWLNLIMDTLAALALATDPATVSLLKRKPDRKDAPLISTDMWKMIIGQSIYQVVMALVLDFRGNDILGLRIPADATPELREYLSATYTIERNSLIFNAFVWCQLFNQVNCRELGRKFNFFAGIHRNKWFMGIILVEIGLQVLISFVGKSAFGIAPLQPDNPARESSRPDWAIVIIIGLVSWPLGVLIRCIPTAPCERALIALGIHSDPNRLPTISHEAKEAEAKEYGEEFGGVAERLSAFSRIRGGRSQMVRLAWKSKSRRMRDADVHPQTLMALVPALIGASVGGGWRPTNPEAASRRDPAAGDPSVSSWQLYQGGAIQLHPDTANDDQFLQKLQAGAGSKAA